MTTRKPPAKRATKPKAAPKVAAPEPEHVLVLRICALDGTSRGGFQWPKSGPVSCPDWRPTKECGNGLHGWLWGLGDHSAANWSTAGNAWLVVRVLASAIVDLNGKVKFPSGEVVHFGDRASATAYLAQHAPGKVGAVIGATRSAGDRGTASAGYLGTASAGDRGTASAGDRGTASAGADGVLVVRYCDGTRWRLKVGYVGEDGIEKGQPYHVEGDRLVAGEHAEAKEAREYAAHLSANKPVDRA